MDPVTMMVASIGMQFFNNYATNKKNAEIQEQQREFQRAAAERDFERMRQAQAAASKLALDLEEEIHEERIEDIKCNYDTLLDNFAHSFAVTDWPLNVLPFIMKGESFGSLIGGIAQTICMHCIFTPSNCLWFNEYFYDDLDLRIEAEMNNNWNAQSTHPIVYYGGGWNRRQKTMSGLSVPSPIDLDDVTLLKNKLSTIPVMVITPYFDPCLHFRVQLWGMGKDSETPYRLDVSQESSGDYKRMFSYDYKKDDNTPKLSDDFFNTTMEEFVPYLTSLIGFVADKYFWSMYGSVPMLPEIIKSKQETTQIKKFVRDNYLKLLQSPIIKEEEIYHNCVFNKERWMSLYKGVKPIIEDKEQNDFITMLLNVIYNMYNIDDIGTYDIINHCFTTEDLPFLQFLIKEIQDKKLRDILRVVYDNIRSQIVCEIIKYDALTFDIIIEHAMNLINAIPDHIVNVKINKDYVLVALLSDDGETFVNDIKNPKCLILQYNKFIVSDKIQIKSSSFKLTKDLIESIYSKIKKLS